MLPELNEENSPNALFKLTERSRLFDQVLSSITDFVYTFDLEGRFTFINKPLLDLWGMTLEEAVGKNFFELPYPPELAAKLQKQIRHVVETGEHISDETPYENPAGAQGFYQYIFSPVFGEDGKVEAVAGSTRDYTERRNLEKEREQAIAALEIERSNLAAVVEEAPSFICFLRGPEHVFDFANERYFELIGRRDILGKTIRESLPQVEEQGFVQMLDSVYETGEPVIGNEVSVSLPSGERVVNFIYQSIRDNDGTIAGVFVHGVDVTALVESRRALEENREHTERQRRLYEAILSNTPDLAYVFTLDYRFAYANDILLQMWGKTAEEAIGKTCLELGYEPWHAEMHNQEIDWIKENKMSLRGEVPFSGTFGRRMYDYILVPVFGENGEVEAVAGTTRDITDRVEMEEKVSDQSKQLAAESRRKDEFLAMLSHELRNPLAPISTAIHLLKLSAKQDEDEQERKAKEIIERQVGNLTKIVNDLLEVSRLVSGRIRLELQTVDLNEMVSHAIETTNPLVDQRSQKLSLTRSAFPLWVSVDPTRIEEVFVNLLNNAAKYTANEGSIEVFCELTPEGDQARIRVRDNGVGIDHELLPIIFDLFTQADRSLDRAAGGLGIGLNLVHRLVGLHNGTILAHSPPGGQTQGSEFIVQLPIVSPSAETKVADVQASERSEAQGARVLVVDDNVDMVMMVTSFLRHNRFSVQFAYNGIDACELAMEWKPEIVILDIGLPGLNGYEVAKRLRAEEATKDAKIIAITGYGRESDIALAHEAGFNAHLTKPYALADLAKLLRSSS